MDRRQTPLVGRRQEMTALTAAIGGEARLVLVLGDAGIGKTRLVGEALMEARSEGEIRVVGCACLPLAQGLALLPFVEALRQLDADPPGGGLRQALAALPSFVGRELSRLLPELAEPMSPAAAASKETGSRERMFAAVAEALAAVCADRPLLLLVEDVHWADEPTLDLLTFLRAGSRLTRLTLLVTARTDEPRHDEALPSWFGHARRGADVVEIRLKPLSRADVALQAEALLGRPPPDGLVTEVWARAEGLPFFTEQLVAAADEDARLPERVPVGLAEVLAQRWLSVGPLAGEALAGLSVAGRPLTEAELAAVLGQDPTAVRVALKELAASHLLGPADGEGGLRPRHALLAEAVVDALLPAERAALHAAVAAVLEASGNRSRAAEVAAHWRAAGRAVDELRAVVAAAELAWQRTAFADAVALWQRAATLAEQEPAAARRLGLDLPRLLLEEIRAREADGDGEGAQAAAEQAYARFREWPDRSTAAALRATVANFRLIWDNAGARSLLQEALDLYEGTPPSRDHAFALYRWAGVLVNEGHWIDALPVMGEAERLATVTASRGVAARVLGLMVEAHLLAGRLDVSTAALDRARSVAAAAYAAGDLEPALTVAITESDLLLLRGRLVQARRVASDLGTDLLRSGLSRSFATSVLWCNVAEASRELGDTTTAFDATQSVRDGPVRRDAWPLHVEAASADLLRGELVEAEGRLRDIRRLQIGGSLGFTRKLVLVAADVALWAGTPGKALADSERQVAALVGTDDAVFAGELLVLGARACADLAAARARGDVDAEVAASDGLARLDRLEEKLAGAAFADHPCLVRIPADLASWRAERSRAGGDHPELWRIAADAWQELGRPHRAAYAWWRCAEAMLGRGDPRRSAAEPLRAAAAGAVGHAPLLTRVKALAGRARVDLSTRAGSTAPAPPALSGPDVLTARELLVLRLVAQGRTNAEIGAELFMSPKTASVHVTNILRKFGVHTRTQAAAVGERAGLLSDIEPADRSSR